VKKKVLVFFPHNPCPPRSGAHRRCLEVMAGLKTLGHDVVLAGSTLSSEAPWDDASVAGLREGGVSGVEVYETTPADHEFLDLLHRLRSLENKLSHPRKSLYYFRQLLKHKPPILATWRGATETPPIDAIQYTPPDMRRWFHGLVKRISPDVIIMNYAYWDGLVDHRKFKSILRIIDTLDLVSLNRQMQGAIARYLPDPLEASTTPDEVLQENFFASLQLDSARYEFKLFDQYDRTIAISAKEVDVIRRVAHHTQVSWLPVTLEPVYVSNTYSGSALFTVGPNLFNTQGYLYFVKKVLPQVRASAPGFKLNVTGAFPFNTPAAGEGVTLSGFVPDLRAVYAAARFFICPVFGGTGQQIKIVEAMAHGLPVVALRFAAERSPLRHEVNGLVADNAEDFAAHTIRLWNDPALCRRLGMAARETIGGEFSGDRLTESLADILQK
jgi:glycosyltransferase involved in cell wall biosynthesis